MLTGERPEGDLEDRDLLLKGRKLGRDGNALSLRRAVMTYLQDIIP